MNVEKLTWYVARAGGIVAWLLLALGLVLGLLLSSGVLGRRASPAWLLSIHRFLGGLSVIFTFVHVAAIMLDDFVAFGWTDVLVPWASEWNPGAVAWGIIATYLAVAIELTSFAMRRLPKRLWRGVHWLSAPLFVMATVHGYQAGTDTGRAFIVAIVASCSLLAALTAVRVARSRGAVAARPDPRVLLEQVKARRDSRDAPAAPSTPTAWTDLAGIEPIAGVTGSPDEPLWTPGRRSTDATAWADAPSEVRAPVDATPHHEAPFWAPTESEPTPALAAAAAATGHAGSAQPTPEMHASAAPATPVPTPAFAVVSEPTRQPNRARRAMSTMEHAGRPAGSVPPRPRWIEADAPAWSDRAGVHPRGDTGRPGTVAGVWKRPVRRRDPAQDD